MTYNFQSYTRIRENFPINIWRNFCGSLKIGSSIYSLSYERNLIDLPPDNIELLTPKKAETFSFPKDIIYYQSYPRYINPAAIKKFAAIFGQFCCSRFI